MRYSNTNLNVRWKSYEMVWYSFIHLFHKKYRLLFFFRLCDGTTKSQKMYWMSTQPSVVNTADWYWLEMNSWLVLWVTADCLALSVSLMNTLVLLKSGQWLPPSIPLNRTCWDTKWSQKSGLKHTVLVISNVERCRGVRGTFTSKCCFLRFYVLYRY